MAVAVAPASESPARPNVNEPPAPAEPPAPGVPRELAGEPPPARLPEPAGTVVAPGFTAVNLRSGPATLFPVIRAVPVGTRVVLIGGPVQSDEIVWQQVRTSLGEVGWLAAGTISH
jgi:hypothetical protein